MLMMMQTLTMMMTKIIATGCRVMIIDDEDDVDDIDDDNDQRLQGDDGIFVETQQVAAQWVGKRLTSLTFLSAVPFSSSALSQTGEKHHQHHHYARNIAGWSIFIVVICFFCFSFNLIAFSFFSFYLIVFPVLVSIYSANPTAPSNK